MKKGESEPTWKTKYTGDHYKAELKRSMYSMWNLHNIEGRKKFEGETYDGVEFRPFKPVDMSIVDYKGRFTPSTREKWQTANYRGFYYQSKWVSSVQV